MQDNHAKRKPQAQCRFLVPQEYRSKRRAATSTHNAKLVLSLYLQANGICQLCGDHVDPEDVSLDHIIPIARGGDDTLANLQLTHMACNYSKGTRTMNEWALGAWRLRRWRLRPDKKRRAKLEQRVRSLAALAHKIGVASAIIDVQAPDTTPMGLTGWREIARLTPEQAQEYLQKWREEIKGRVEAMGRFDKSSTMLEQAAYWARLRNLP